MLILHNHENITKFGVQTPFCEIEKNPTGQFFDF